MKEIFKCSKSTNRIIMWKPDGWTFAITNSHFHALIDEFIDVNEDNRFYAIEVTLHAGHINKTDYEETQTLLSTRLFKAVKQNPDILNYQFLDEDARKQAIPFLKAYSDYTQLISCEIIYMDDGSSDVVRFKRRRETIFGRFSNRFGQSYGETNFHISDVKKIEGSPLNFTLTLTSGSKLYFHKI